MKRIGNLIWLVPYGIFFAGLHVLLGIALCCTLIFIPFGLQHFKLARYTCSPFNTVAYTNFDKRPIMNMFWIAFGGYLLSFVHILVGAVLCLTLIGIPFGKKCFRLASLSFLPFGATIV